MKLTFLGGAGTVTGSKIVLEVDYKKIMIDCGLFQRLKELPVKNWESLFIKPSDIDFLILTHAHLDHSGYLPVLVRDGFKGNIFCTKATKDLTSIILIDSGKIQEEDARRANEHEYSRHKPAKPLYTVNDAKIAINHLKTIDFEQWYPLDENIKFKL